MNVTNLQFEKVYYGLDLNGQELFAFRILGATRTKSTHDSQLYNLYLLELPNGSLVWRELPYRVFEKPEDFLNYSLGSKDSCVKINFVNLDDYIVRLEGCSLNAYLRRNCFVWNNLTNEVISCCPNVKYCLVTSKEVYICIDTKCEDKQIYYSKTDCLRENMNITIRDFATTRIKLNIVVEQKPSVVTKLSIKEVLI
jgi:hypothetical protein